MHHDNQTCMKTTPNGPAASAFQTAARGIDWDDLRVFIAVAKQGSLSRAATSLGVTQPTVGRRIRELETQLDCRLFDRLATGYRLTACGERAFEQAAKLPLIVRDIANEVRGDVGATEGVVKITAPDGIGVHWLAPRLPVLKQLYPNLTIELDTTMDLRNLHGGEADIALRMGDTGSDDLIGRRIAHVPFHLFASVAYIANRGVPADFADLGRHEFIGGGGALASLPQVRLLRRFCRNAVTAASVDTILAQVSLVSAGAGLVSLPSYIADTTPGIERILRESFGISMPLWLLTRQDLRETARIRAVLQFIIDEAKASLPQRELSSGIQ